MKFNEKVYCSLLAFAVLSLMIYGITNIILGIQFDRNCEGYLKRAADANTISMAEKELGIAVTYMEQKHLIIGYTSIVYKTPNEDLGFWYNNLKVAHEELVGASPDITSLEMSNMLMKLRETILDDDREGVSVTVPPGIVRFPHNTFFAFWGITSSLIGVVGFVMFGKTRQERMYGKT